MGVWPLYIGKSPNFLRYFLEMHFFRLKTQEDARWWMSIFSNLLVKGLINHLIIVTTTSFRWRPESRSSGRRIGVRHDGMKKVFFLIVTQSPSPA